VFDPVVANGIVYVGSLNGIYTAGAVLAYPTRCEALCNPLWTASVEGAVESALSVVNGTIYAGTLTGALYTFGLPPSWGQGRQ
jgi:outer membrane protein assembly factor BamB